MGALRGDDRSATGKSRSLIDDLKQERFGRRIFLRTDADLTPFFLAKQFGGCERRPSDVGFGMQDLRFLGGISVP